ncbi:MAG: glutamate racemase [Lachnospiraceae bacterium]|nr:glutamate racemase [Lachnospiraceae bacterium]
MSKLDNNTRIGVLDSGVGGISVLRELIKVMPEEEFLFYGDSKNAPYGAKSTEEVRRLTFDVVDYLLGKGCKAIAVACNTATSAAVRALRETYDYLPVVGIEPAVKPAALDKEHPKVLVMATPVTIREVKFKRLTDRFTDGADIIPLPCPGLMEFVERGELSGENLDRFLGELLAPYLKEGIDSIVLGCTHYPFVRSTIEKLAGPGVKIFDGANGTAKEMKRRIEEAGLLRSTPRGEAPQVIFENSAPTPEKLKLCEMLLQQK